MTLQFKISDPVGLINLTDFKFGESESVLKQITIKEISMAESLLTPGLQTSVTVQSYLYTDPAKNFDELKSKPVSFSLERILNKPKGTEGSPLGTKISVNQIVYRLDNRKQIPNNLGQNEEFVVHACDESLLKDTQKLVSKSWKCTKPSEIVSAVLKNCVEVNPENMVIDDADPARDYIAENIHPFQVISQQSNVALYQGDPSFLHYMTYAPYGSDDTTAKPMHYFRSVKKLTESGAAIEYKYSETGRDGAGGYSCPTAIISLMFPCDFDYLADLLNGIDINGKDQNSLSTSNLTQKSMSLLGNQDKGCGQGGYNYKTAITNMGSAEAQNSCNLDVETHLLKRQARMALLERDKIALRITVPWDPGLHAGTIINLSWKNKYGSDEMYGHGEYMVLHLNHTIRMGGFSTTTMDCVSKTVGGGQT